MHAHPPRTVRRGVMGSTPVMMRGMIKHLG
jgi:hypothetical protein